MAKYCAPGTKKSKGMQTQPAPTKPPKAVKGGKK